MITMMMMIYYFGSQAWWHMLAILAVKRLKPEDPEFKASNRKTTK